MGRTNRRSAAKGRPGRSSRRGRAEEKRGPEAERCGLCGKRKRLTRTECCGRPICDDESDYVLFSYARSSCSRNHRRFTLCGLHHVEAHKGDWKSCVACREYFAELEMYVYYGTNEYNFETLENPPACQPTHCGGCGKTITLGTDGYSVGPEGYRCEDCFED
jgi:hypothetical protein